MFQQKKTWILLVLIIIVGSASVFAWWFYERPQSNANQVLGDNPQTNIALNTPEPDTEKPKDTTETNQQPAAPAAFNKEKYSITEPNSLWVIVNKKRPLPSNYIPADLTVINGGQLRGVAVTPLEQLLREAAAKGVPMRVLSAYRSYATQSTTYNGYVAQDGAALADTYSARPGHSEHQTGLAVDLGNGTCDLESCFGKTKAGLWLAANAPKYGFLIRYLENKTPITGYQYEPWHIRYVGEELAKEVSVSNQTLEEYFGLEAAPNY